MSLSECTVWSGVSHSLRLYSCSSCSRIVFIPILLAPKMSVAIVFPIIMVSWGLVSSFCSISWNMRGSGLLYPSSLDTIMCLKYGFSPVFF